MKIIGITGGIGSGKTTICGFFEAFGIPVYYADDEAKKLINTSKVIRRKLIALFGEMAYKDDVLNRDFIRRQIFTDDDLRFKMNSIVHPKVKRHFEKWLKRQNSIYVLKEAAIIFEINQQDQYDKIILVTADRDIRIKRVVERDGIAVADVEKIISKQISDNEKIKMADYIIVNHDLNESKSQALKIHKKLSKIC